MASDAALSEVPDAPSINSMTGFATGTGSHADWQISYDIRSVNGRGLDIRLRVPDWIEGLETELRKYLQANIGRGSVTVSVRVTKSDIGPEDRLSVEGLHAALSLVAKIEKAATTEGVDLGATRASDIAAMKGVLDQREPNAEDTTSLKKSIMADIQTTLSDFDADRRREGTALANVLRQQLDQVYRLTQDASDALGDREAAARNALERNLARILDSKDMPDETRILQELALIAVKSDVTEELDRLSAHIQAARAHLTTPAPVGRKLDFLMQEFNREANTLCSKAQSAELTSIGLELKAVIDQMREQVQNIE